MGTENPAQAPRKERLLYPLDKSQEIKRVYTGKTWNLDTVDMPAPDFDTQETL